MSEPSKAVFLSYASQDAEAAKRISDALRAVGVEVWFDQSELVGGDQWDAKIRKQIKDCALLIPIISAATQARTEGYFRLEWRLADQRTHLMGRGRAFLLPVCIDDTKDADADVPDSFASVQWTRLPGGETPPKFAERVKKLLGGSEAVAGVGDPGRSPASPRPATAKPSRTWLMPAIIGVVALAGLALWQPWKKVETNPAVTKPLAAITPLSEAQRLVQQARALLDDDPLAVRENFVTAYELAERAAALSPDDGEIWATLARANHVLIRSYRQDSDRQMAAWRSQVERAIRLAPQSVEAGLAKARFEFAVEENLPAARARLEALVARAPGDRRIYQSLTYLQRDKAEDLPEARRWAEQANRLPGGDAKSLIYLAWLEWGLNRLGDCQITVDRSFALQPSADAYQLKLMLYNVRGDLAGAREHLARIPGPILQEDRVAIIAYELLAAQGEYEQALKIISGIPRDVLQEGRYFAVRGYLAGEALRALGRTNAATLEYQSALKVIDERLAASPRESRLHFARSLVLFRLGDRESATRHLQTAQELGGSGSREREALVLLGRTDQAVAVFDRDLDRERSRWFAALRSLKSDPVFTGLRADPRAQVLIERGDRWLAEALKPTEPAPDAAAPSPSSLSLNASGLPQTDQKSVAVLAFANLSDDKANEYFSDGISEELLNVLARVPGLKVSARTSAFHFKGKDTPIPEIAKQLGVAYVVEGSVRKQGDKVRITAQLIKAADGFHVWSDTFTRDLKDIFAVQDEIAGLVAKQLSLKLGVSSAASKAAVNPEAYELYLRARQAFSLLSFDQAETALTQALALEPNFARAHAALADVWLQRFRRVQRTSEAEDQSLQKEKARIMAKIVQALALDPDSAEARTSLGSLLLVDGNYAEAETVLRRAVALNPNQAFARFWLGRALLYLGHMNEALEQVQRSTQLDPLDRIFWGFYGQVLNHAGRKTEGITALDRSLALRPDFSTTVASKCFALLELGRVAEAVVLVRRLPAKDWTTGGAQLRVFAQAGLKDEAEALLAGSRPPGYTTFRWEAGSLVALGRSEEALALLTSKSVDSSVGEQLWEPIFDPVRHDPRWVKLMADAGLTEAHARAQAWRQANPPEQGEATK